MLNLGDIPSSVCEALVSGELSANDLTARRLGAFAGKTTSLLYHHWGCLDGFLYAVAQAGMARLGKRLLVALEREDGLASAAEEFVQFGMEHPVLYDLMFVRRFDWDALRKRGSFDAPGPGLGLWAHLVGYFESRDAEDAEGDARLLFAGLHGLVHLAGSGRANVGAISVSDRDTALRAARALARRLESKDLDSKDRKEE